MLLLLLLVLERLLPPQLLLLLLLHVNEQVKKSISVVKFSYRKSCLMTSLILTP